MRTLANEFVKVICSVISANNFQVAVSNASNFRSTVCDWKNVCMYACKYVCRYVRILIYISTYVYVLMYVLKFSQRCKVWKLSCNSVCRVVGTVRFKSVVSRICSSLYGVNNNNNNNNNNVILKAKFQIIVSLSNLARAVMFSGYSQRSTGVKVYSAANDVCIFSYLLSRW